MTKTYRLGIDVGGTNTDAVILNQQFKVVDSVKRHTTKDIATGIINSMDAVIKDSKLDPNLITYAMLGTTQCTNAIVERKHLSKIGVIRIGYPATASIPPYTDWNDNLKKMLGDNYKIVHGGYEYNGDTISKLNDHEIIPILKQWKQKGIKSIAIIGVFSSVKNDQEIHVAKLAKKILGNDVTLSLSSNIGSLGLIERENATILNASLNKVIKNTTEGFAKALKNEGISNARMYLCQNDGTLMSIDYAKKYPVLTIGSGPTNSLRGASYLSHLNNAIVLDIGGTTSDIGVLSNGFPRESSNAVTIGGVKTNFRMPDITSIGIAGGSIIHNSNGKVTVGPDSVGYKITQKALCFGGHVVTATDIADRLGNAKIGNPKLTDSIPKDLAVKALKYIKKQLEQSIDKMKTSSADIPLVLVGGGAIIAPNTLKGVSKIIRNKEGGVANSIGATIAQVSGDFEQIFTYANTKRSVALKKAKEAATEQAIKAGAKKNTIKVADVNEVALAYAPGDATRVKLKVVGDLA